jgi:hypothetical protein
MLKITIDLIRIADWVCMQNALTHARLFVRNNILFRTSKMHELHLFENKFNQRTTENVPANYCW